MGQPRRSPTSEPDPSSSAPPGPWPLLGPLPRTPREPAPGSVPGQHQDRGHTPQDPDPGQTRIPEHSSRRCLRVGCSRRYAVQATTSFPSSWPCCSPRRSRAAPAWHRAPPPLCSRLLGCATRPRAPQSPGPCPPSCGACSAAGTPRRPRRNCDGRLQGPPCDRATWRSWGSPETSCATSQTAVSSVGLGGRDPPGRPSLPRTFSSTEGTHPPRPAHKQSGALHFIHSSPRTPAGTRGSGNKVRQPCTRKGPLLAAEALPPLLPHCCFTPFEAFLQMPPLPGPPSPALHPNPPQAFTHLCPLPESPTQAGHPALGTSLPCKRCPAPTPSLPCLHTI